MNKREDLDGSRFTLKAGEGTRVPVTRPQHE
jgi:hypothetical protein